MKPITRFLFGILTSGTFSAYDITVRSRIIFLNAVLIVGMVTLGSFSAIALSAGNRPLGYTTAAACGLLFLLLVVVRLSRWFVVGNHLATIIVFALFAYLYLTGGEQGSGVLWVLSYPLVALFLLGIGAGSVWALGFMALIAVAIWYPELDVYRFAPDYGVRILGSYVFIYLFGLTYELVRRATQRILNSTNQGLQQTTQALAAAKSQTDAILANVTQGIFLLDRDLRIGPAYSAFLELLFDRLDLADVDFLELITPLVPPDVAQATADYLPMLFDDSVNPDLLVEINPLDQVRLVFEPAGEAAFERTVRFGFRPAAVSADEWRILAIAEDVTAGIELQRQLDAEARRHQSTMERLFQVVHIDPQLMLEFLSETDDEITRLNAGLRDRELPVPDTLSIMYQSVHGIKGNALLLGLDQLAKLLHGLEDSIKRGMVRSETIGWEDLYELTVAIGSIHTDLEETREVIDKVLSFNRESARSGLSRGGLMERALQRLVEREAQAHGKQVRLKISGLNELIGAEADRRPIKDIIIQLIRNSIVHGIERPEERRRLGKTAEAQITVSITGGGDHFDFQYADDGSGLDLAKIRAAAANLPELAGTDPRLLSESQLSKLIFRVGFSTSPTAEMSAGRGAGMALVRRRAKELGGKITVRNRSGIGFGVQIVFPTHHPAAAAAQA